MRPIAKSPSVSLGSKSDIRDSDKELPPRTEKRTRHDRPGAWLQNHLHITKNSNDCPHLSRAYVYQFCGLRSHSLDNSLAPSLQQGAPSSRPCWVTLVECTNCAKFAARFRERLGCQDQSEKKKGKFLEQKWREMIYLLQFNFTNFPSKHKVT